MKTPFVVVAVFTFLGPASAQSPKDAIKQFGIVGSWSENCSANLEREAGTRYAFEAPFFGAAKYVVSQKNAKWLYTSTMQISQATRTTEDKIRIIGDVIDVKYSDGQKPNDNAFVKGMDMVYRREGANLRLFETRPAPGQPSIGVSNGAFGGEPTPRLEKCLN